MRSEERVKKLYDENGDKARQQMVKDHEKLTPVIGEVMSVLQKHIDTKAITYDEAMQVLGKSLGYCIKPTYESAEEFKMAGIKIHRAISVNVLPSLPLEPDYVSKQGLLLLAACIPDYIRCREIIGDVEIVPTETEATKAAN